MRVFGWQTHVRNESDRLAPLIGFIIGRPCVLVTKGLSVSIDVGTRKMVNYA